MKSKTMWLSGGIVAAIAAALNHFGNDSTSNTHTLITTILGGGGILSVVMGLIPETIGGISKGISPDFLKAIHEAMADGHLTKDEASGILKALFQTTPSDTPADATKPTLIVRPVAPKDMTDMGRIHQIMDTYMELGPVAKMIKDRGAPSYVKSEYVWDATTVLPFTLGTDPRTVAPVGAIVPN